MSTPDVGILTEEGSDPLSASVGETEGWAPCRGAGSLDGGLVRDIRQVPNLPMSWFLGSLVND